LLKHDKELTLTSMLSYLLAAAATTQANRPWFAGFFDNPMYVLVVVFVVFIFMQMKSKRSQEKQREQLLDALKKGDRVRTIGGMLGTVVEVRENEVVVKVDETNNTKVRFVRSAIHVVVEGEKAAGESK
jgi:preprotein translocase subunit YajC